MMADSERAPESCADLELELSRLERAASGSRWCPHTPTDKQRAFLDLETFEAFYGGAAGGGKSDALLMECVRDADKPGYSALALRRAYTDLTLPGALMDRAAEWLRPTSAQYADRTKTWRFPSGAKLAFGYLELDKHLQRYKSAEFQCVVFDELTEFTEYQYRYMMSRIRRPRGSELRLRARGASNPGNVGHEWVFERFVQTADPDRPFIPARIPDNPHLDQEAYRRSLAELDETTRKQLELGLWVRDAARQMYPYGPENLCAAEDLPPANERSHILAIDLGSSEIKRSSAFCVFAWGPHDTHCYVVKAWKESALDPTAIADRMAWARDEYDTYTVVVDEGGLGSGYSREFRARHGAHTTPAEKKDKRGFRKLLIGALERGEVRIVADDCRELLLEMDAVEWDDAGITERKGQEPHATDALLYGWRFCRNYLATMRKVKPRHGTPEWYAEQERKMEQDEMDEHERKTEGWWRR
jgi:hypothetical protein